MSKSANPFPREFEAYMVQYDARGNATLKVVRIASENGWYRIYWGPHYWNSSEGLRWYQLQRQFDNGILVRYDNGILKEDESIYGLEAVI